MELDVVVGERRVVKAGLGIDAVTIGVVEVDLDVGFCPVVKA